MTKEEIIEYLYENNVRGDLTIEQMAEDLADTPQTDYLVKAQQKSRDGHEIDTPQTDCDKLINAVVKLDMSRENKFKVIELLERHCEKCKHYLFTDIDGCYCEHETYGQPCNYEPKDEPQTERPSCETCKWDSEEWYDRHCDSCVAHTDKPSNYEPQTDCPWK